MTPHDIQAWLIEEGYRAKLEVDEDGDTVIHSSSDGMPFDIVFYAPEPPDGEIGGFDHISFTAAAMREGGTSLEEVNDINLSEPYLRASRHEDGALVVDYRVIAYPETVIKRLWEELFGMWTHCLSDVLSPR
jgi:Putative bacterial sensory transduction regulator